MGSEPRISFHEQLLKFGPVFPFSQGDYKDVLVTNPTSFPLEIYSLEYDTQYIEEEEVKLCINFSVSTAMVNSYIYWGVNVKLKVKMLCRLRIRIGICSLHYHPKTPSHFVSDPCSPFENFQYFIDLVYIFL